MAFEINITTSKALGKIEVLSTKIRGISTQITALNTKGIALGRIGTQAKELKANAAIGALGLQQINKSMSQLQASNDTVNQGMVELNKQVGAMGNKAGKSGAQLKNLRGGLNKTANEAAVLRAAMYATGTHFGAFTAQTLLAATAAYAFVSAIASIIKVGAEFEQTMARVNAVMGNFGTSSEAIADARTLDKEVKRLGRTTVFTVNEVAEGLLFLGMAGLSTSEAAKALEPVLSVASIGMIDMAQAADIATNIMLGFGRTANDLAEIVDIMSVAITSSNMDMKQLGNSLSYVAPVAEATNNSLKDTVAILEIFHNVGIKSSRAGTSLRRAMINLSKPTEKVSKVLTRLGVSLFDQENKMRPIIDIMRQFTVAQASVADISAIFGARAAPALLAFYKDLQKEVDGGTSSFQKLRGELEANEGKAAQIRKGIEDTLPADWKLLVSALSGLSLVIFEELVPALRSAVTGTTELIQAMDGKQVIAFGEALLTIVAAKYLLVPLIGKAIVGLVAFRKQALITAAATRILVTSLAVLSGPIGWAALVAGLAIYVLTQKSSVAEYKNAALASEMERNALEGLAKLKRDIVELDDKGIKISKAKAKVSLAELEAAKRAQLFAVDMASKDVTKKENKVENQEQLKFTSKTRVLRDSRKEVTDAQELLGIRLASLVTLQNRIVATKAELELYADILGTRKLNREENAKAIKDIQDMARATKDLDAATIIAKRNKKTEGNLSTITRQEKLGILTSSQAAKKRSDEYAGALTYVNSQLDIQIAKQDKLLKPLNKAVFSPKDDASAKDIARVNEELKKQKLIRESIEKAKANFGASTLRKDEGELDYAALEGRKVSDSLKSIWEKEAYSYEIRMTNLRAFHKKRGIVGAEAAIKEGELTLKTGASQVASAAGYIGQLINMAADASQRKYDVSKQEADDSYALWQTAQERQAQFQQAANSAQTAGDERYYQNLSDQYRAYSSVYKKQFEERDAIARKNFESNKSMQIAQTRINTIAGAAMVLAQLGYWGIPIAAGMVKLGQDMVSDIKGQQYTSAGADSSSGAFGGLPSAVDTTSNIGGGNIGASPRSDGQTNALNIYIEGAITEEMINDVVIPVIQDGINDRDIILISGTGADSAQLAEVQGAQ